MASTTNILKALSAYTGDADSLDSFVQVAQTELGDDWTHLIETVLPDLPASLKEKLDHALQYYGATAAWNEVQTYLQQETPLDVEQIEERIPTLEYWLAFFEQAGLDVLEELRARIENEKLNPPQIVVEEQPITADTPVATESAVQDPLSMADDTQEGSAEVLPEGEEFVPEMPADTSFVQDVTDEGAETDAFVGQKNLEYPLEDENYPIEDGASDLPAQDYMSPELPAEEYMDDINAQPQEEFMESPYMLEEGQEETPYLEGEEEPPYLEGEEAQAWQDEGVYAEQEPVSEEEMPEAEPVPYVAPVPETNEQFMAKKAFHQVDFINSVRSWINARCIALGQIEIYAYKYYGFLVDVMEQTKKDVEEILSDPVYYPAIEQERENGLQIMQNMLRSLEEDLQIAYDNAPSEATPLIDDDLGTSDLKNSLGRLDTSNQKEYLGPAPDGFEMVDDPYEFESATSTVSASAPASKAKASDKSPAGMQGVAKNNTSQTAQTGVQRKISFTFNKKPS